MGRQTEAEKIYSGPAEETAEATAVSPGGTRDRIIIRTSIIGILANVFLAAFKAAVGIVTNSIAIILDAVNNLSDAGSSLITIVGTKLAARQPDKKHPFGHGRIEYLSAMVIAVIVLYAGLTSFTESVKKIIHPDKPDYTVPALIVVASDWPKSVAESSSRVSGMVWPAGTSRAYHPWSPPRPVSVTTPLTPATELATARVDSIMHRWV